MTNHLGLDVITGTGWFDAPYIRTMLDAENPERMRDIEGPESDELVERAGLSFTEEPLHAALVYNGSKTLAVAWITATNRGLNLTYATSHSAQRRGLATLAAACAVLAYGEQRISSSIKTALTVHAQYDQFNRASACIAHHLGFTAEPSLSFNVTINGQHRTFVGSEAPWLSVVSMAKVIRAKMLPNG
jgi:hypothetical protein